MISKNVVCATSKASDQPAHTRSLNIEYFMSVKLLTEHHLKFLSLKGGCTGSSESTLVKMPHCWKSHVTAHLFVICFIQALIKQFEEDDIPVLHMSTLTETGVIEVRNEVRR